jgi:hypothetical protein
MDAAKPTHVYLIVNTATDSTTALICPFKTYQHLNRIFSANPAAYKLRRDFVEMESALETSRSVEMLTGVFVSRYRLEN